MNKFIEILCTSFPAKLYHVFSIYKPCQFNACHKRQMSRRMSKTEVLKTRNLNITTGGADLTQFLSYIHALHGMESQLTDLINV